MNCNSAQIVNVSGLYLHVEFHSKGKNAFQLQEASPCTAGTAALQAINPNCFDTADK